jgi:hypothetical protein
MTQRSPEKLREVVEMIASGVLSPRKAAQACGVPPSTYWDWFSASQRGDERFIITYCGEEMPFHKAVALGRKIALADALGKFETRCLEGDESPVFFQGRPSWVEDERLSTLDDATLEILGYPDRYLRVNGKRVQHTIKSAPPVAAVVKLLEANFKTYAQRSEVNINARHSGGVSVVRVPKILPVVEIVPPPQIAPPVEVPEDETCVPGESSELPKLADSQARKSQTPEPPIAEEPAPPQYERRAAGPLSSLERDLLEKLRQGVTNPRPSRPVTVGRPSDEH